MTGIEVFGWAVVAIAALFLIVNGAVIYRSRNAVKRRQIKRGR